MVYPESGSTYEPDTLSDTVHHAFKSPPQWSILLFEVSPLPFLSVFHSVPFFCCLVFTSYFPLHTSHFLLLTSTTRSHDLRSPDYRLLFTCYYLPSIAHTIHPHHRLLDHRLPL